MLQRCTSWGVKGLQTDFSQGRKAIDTQLVLKHIPKAQWLESKLQLSLWICGSVLNDDAFLRREVAQTWKYKTSTACTSSSCFHNICASIKQICKVTMRSIGCIFMDSCCLLKTCRWLTELWTELRYISPPPPCHSWALGFVAVSRRRDGSLCLSKMTRGKGFYCMTSKVWACCSLFLSRAFPP